MLRKARGAEKKVKDSSGRDIKLDLDLRSEETIVTILREHIPYAIHCEEQGNIGSKEASQEYHWIVDPLDGSLNFFRGFPLCSVSVALYDGKEPLLGVVYDFIHDDLYQGIPGQGAWLNGKTIGVSSIDEIDKAILCTGFPVSTDFSRQAIEEFVFAVRKYKKVRLLGSAALSLAFVASGKADAYFERDIKIWDVAAGIALVEAAGGKVKRAGSNSPDAMTVFASNSALISPKLE